MHAQFYSAHISAIIAESIKISLPARLLARRSRRENVYREGVAAQQSSQRRSRQIPLRSRIHNKVFAKFFLVLPFFFGSALAQIPSLLSSHASFIWIFIFHPIIKLFHSRARCATYWILDARSLEASKLHKFFVLHSRLWLNPIFDLKTCILCCRCIGAARHHFWNLMEIYARWYWHMCSWIVMYSIPLGKNIDGFLSLRNLGNSPTQKCAIKLWMEIRVKSVFIRCVLAVSMFVMCVRASADEHYTFIRIYIVHFCTTTNKQNYIHEKRA